MALTRRRGGLVALLLGTGIMLATATAHTGDASDIGDDDIVTIDGLSHWFGPVAFPHADHQDMVDDCTDCHHHAEGETETCDTCHETVWSAAAPAMPSLGVAYHRACAGCHGELGGPTGCEDCHRRQALPPGPALRGFATP